MLGSARAAVQEADQELHDAQQRLAVAESGAAIGASDVDRGARRHMLGARDAADLARARVTGLEDRLRTAAKTVTEAQRLLAVEFRNWKREQTATYIEQVYQPALDTLLDAMRTLVAVGTALGANRLLAIPRQTFVADPADPVRNLASRHRLAWRDDPESLATFERLVALGSVIVPLLGEFADGPVPQESDDGVAA